MINLDDGIEVCHLLGTQPLTGFIAYGTTEHYGSSFSESLLTYSGMRKIKETTNKKGKAMSELVIELPPEVQRHEAKLLLMIKLYETGKLSLGQAAKFSGYSKGAFMELLGKYDVPVFDYPAGDLKQEMDL
jgi:predicted HTH domain antitoxin